MTSCGTCLCAAKILIGLANELTTLNAPLARTEREIEFLREYRARLIADVVTGTLDVGATAANLPAQVEPATESTDSETQVEEDTEEATVEVN